MIINGRRVSREALVGDPGLFFAGGMFRRPSRPMLASRNSVTAAAALGTTVGTIGPPARRGLLGRLGGALGTIAGIAGPGLLGGPAGLLAGPLTRAARTAFGSARFGLGVGAGLAGQLAGGRERMTKRGGMTTRRRPRMRVTNTKPLLRALRRVRGFERVARGVITIGRRFRHHPQVRRRRGFGRRRAA